MSYITPMFAPMRKLSGRKSGGLRKALERKREELSRYGMEEMNAMLGQWLDPELFRSEGNGLFSRRRLFDFGTTFQAFLWQTLQGQASCREAVRHVQMSRIASSDTVPDTGTSAFCQARANLPMKRLEKINSAVLDKLGRLTREEDRWMGREVKILDGTAVTMEDTPKNAAAYAYGCGQAPGCGFPQLHMVGMFSLSSGAWLGYATAGSKRHDLPLSLDLVKTQVEAGDVVLGDRGFCAYWMLALLKGKGADGVMRLHQARPTDMRRGKRIGKEQRLLTWTKPKRPKKCPLSEEEYAKLPEQLTVRILRTRSEIKGYRTSEMLLVTTLCESEKIPAESLAELYRRRWQIELNFDDIKTSLGMDHLACKSPRMVERAMIVYACAYNLIRAGMLEAAVRTAAPLYRLSFKGSTNAVLKALMGNAGSWKSVKKTRQLWEVIIDLIAEDLLPTRPGRREPRALKKRPKRFQLLTKPRNSFKEIAHRNRYKANNPLN